MHRMPQVHQPRRLVTVRTPRDRNPTGPVVLRWCWFPGARTVPRQMVIVTAVETVRHDGLRSSSRTHTPGDCSCHPVRTRRPGRCLSQYQPPGYNRPGLPHPGATHGRVFGGPHAQSHPKKCSPPHSGHVTTATPPRNRPCCASGTGTDPPRYQPGSDGPVPGSSQTTPRPGPACTPPHAAPRSHGSAHTAVS